jgi:hypothetical protein
MVKVGINNDLVLSKAEVTSTAENASLKFTFRDKGSAAAGAAPVSAFDQLAGDGAVDTSSDVGNSVLLFSPLPPKAEDTKGATKTASSMAAEAVANLGERKNILIQILSQFTTLDKIKFNMFQGMDQLITADTYEQRIIEKGVLIAAFTNLANQFVAQVEPFLDNDDLAVRLLLRRQSKDKHYATFRERYVNNYPFIELASIPAEATKLVFTAYEIQQGFNSGDPVAKAAADATAEQAPTSVADMFKENSGAGAAATT